MNSSTLKREVESLFNLVKERCTQSELVIICPTCPPHNPDKSGNRSINLKTGKTNCWRCNKGFRSFSHFCQSLGVELDSEDWIEPDITAVDELADQIRDKDSVAPVLVECKLPRGFTRLVDDSNSAYSKAIGKMAEKKHLSWRILAEAGVGFTRETTWEPYAIFPVIEYGRTVYYQGRLYSSEPGQKTKKFPSNSEVQFGSKFWVYNIDTARERKAKTIFIVESILNVLSFERQLEKRGIKDVAAVCVFKHSVSRPQLTKLLSLKCAKEFSFCWDADSTQHAWKAAELLVNQREVSVTEISPTHGRTTDVNDDASAAFEAFMRRKKLSRPSDALDRLVNAL